MATRRFDVDDFMRMGEMGLLVGRVELADGEVLDMALQGTDHSVCVSRLTRRLFGVLHPPIFIKIQSTHRFANDVAYEPDLAVLASEPVSRARRLTRRRSG